MRAALIATIIQLAIASNATAIESRSNRSPDQNPSATSVFIANPRSSNHDLQPDGVSEIRIVNTLGTVATRRSTNGPDTTTSTTLAEGVVFTAVLRKLSDTGRTVSDDLGGWRLEKRFPAGTLHSVEDQLGLLVRVVRDARGRPFGLILGNQLEVEYGYSEADGSWQRKKLYQPQTGEILAEITNDEAIDTRSAPPSVQSQIAGDLSIQERSSIVGPPAEQPTDHGGERHIVTYIEGRRYASLPHASRGTVIRSVTVDGPAGWKSHDRIDYTDSELVVHLSTGDPERTVTVTVPRHTDDDLSPVVIEGEENSVSRYFSVMSAGKPTKSRASAEPSFNMSLSSSATATLREAFPIALERVRSLADCRSLFDALVVSGNERLTSTFYVPPTAAQTANSCSKGAVAFTHVGSPVTYLCSGFGALSPEEAAVVVIHEALHFAGLPEAPSNPEALNSRQINRLVQEACGF
jgi:hypothetical protein